MLDYLVVGLGLAGISFSEVLEREGKSFRVISDDSQISSKVAGGLYNPVILKRFTPAWKAREQLDVAIPFYRGLEEKLGVKLDHKIPVLRRFSSVEEQNLWFEAADRVNLSDFLSTLLIPNKNSHIDAPLGYGRVLHTGRVDTYALLKYYGQYVLDRQLGLRETFEYDALKIFEDHLEYKSVKAKNIVFAEGFGLSNNPYFNYLPLKGTKGELLTIKAADLQEKNVIKSSVFIIPMGDDIYRIGATYTWEDKSNAPTEEARQELLTKLKGFLKCDFEVVDHVAGIRPTVADRRPLVGRHPEHPNLFVLNGLGSRGVLIAPYASAHLYANIEKQVPLPDEMDILRFIKRYRKRI